jgi:2-hydroxychromene-2-carboxylate isomerase
MTMTRKALAQAIEDDGRYYHVKIARDGSVTGVPVGNPSHYNKNTNCGGRVYIGTDTELLSSLIQCGAVDESVEYAYI